MTGPTTDRQDPPLRGTEVETLLGFLDYQRATLRRKVVGLDAEQLSRPLPPSDLTLGGMLSHLTLVEDWWFSVVLADNPAAPPWDDVDWDADNDWDWHRAEGKDLSELLPLYDDTVRRCDQILGATLAEHGLEALSARESRKAKEPFSLRWIVLHMIEEYARHLGHADLLRESIDGEVGE